MKKITCIIFILILVVLSMTVCYAESGWFFDRNDNTVQYTITQQSNGSWVAKTNTGITVTGNSFDEAFQKMLDEYDRSMGYTDLLETKGFSDPKTASEMATEGLHYILNIASSIFTFVFLIGFAILLATLIKLQIKNATLSRSEEIERFGKQLILCGISLGLSQTANLIPVLSFFKNIMLTTRQAGSVQGVLAIFSQQVIYTIRGLSGLLALTGLFCFIILFTRLGANSSNPVGRAKVIKSMVLSGIITAISGSFSIIGLFIGLFK